LPNSDLVPGVYEGVQRLILFCCIYLIYFIFFVFMLSAFMIRFVFWDAGGLKLWEGSLDLINALQAEVRNGHLSFSGKRVLEVGT
jgi:hypothetical protein